MLQWFPLEGVQNGEVHLKLEWFALKTDASQLTEVASLLSIKNIYILVLQVLYLTHEPQVCSS